MDKHKICTICGEEKDRDQFYKHRRQCKPCYKERNKKKVHMDDEEQTLELLENLSLDDQSSKGCPAYANETDERMEDKTFPGVFDHPGFKLIHVDGHGVRLVSLSDMSVRNDVKSRGYWCISHCWGDVTNSLWKDHGVDGINYEVFVREEKRNAFLQIFKRKGYWWIDLFCVDQRPDAEKPLEIMHHIYSSCKECLCLLDCDNRSMKKIIRYTRGTSNRDLYDMPAKKFSTHFGNVISSKWFMRVWTLQEIVSAKISVMISEGFDEWKVMDAGRLIDIYMHIYKVSNEWTLSVRKELDDSMQQDIEIIHELKEFSEYRDWEEIGEILEILRKSKRSCSKYVDYFYGVAHMLVDKDIPWGLSDKDAVDFFLQSLNKLNTFVTPDVFKNGSCSNLGSVYSNFKTNTNLVLLQPYEDSGDDDSEDDDRNTGTRITYGFKIIDTIVKSVDEKYMRLFDDDQLDLIHGIRVSDKGAKKLSNRDNLISYVNSRLPEFEADYTTGYLEFIWEEMCPSFDSQTYHILQIGGEKRNVEWLFVRSWIVAQSGHHPGCNILELVPELDGYWIYITRNKVVLTKKKLRVGSKVYEYEPICREVLMCLVDGQWPNYVYVGNVFPVVSACRGKCKDMHETERD
ncbi:hypothetical protein MVEG_12411 [Podila verticillata NRRL 6337]|uniref:Heterokaryon incompatibility domain-containing protein n=1 Tax=Podila verticillata NRRL 6337 TaxID=1069443 RepID=A0A086TIH4_9FUNG|nr:hypothetical protein MVEG_12411 [Podila verticillata NRRL 6337]